MTLRLLLTIHEVAAALGIGRRTAYLLRGRPGFPAPITLCSRIVRYRASEVADYAARLAADVVTAPEPAKLTTGRAAWLALPKDERDARRAARQAERASVDASGDGLVGGLATPVVARRRPARGSADGTPPERILPTVHDSASK